jgi:hypothetical protein
MDGPGRRAWRAWVRLLGAVLAAVATPALAATPPLRDDGEQVAAAAHAQDRGYGDEIASGRMLLRDARGREAARAFELRVLEADDGGDRRRIVFAAPPDVRGTALLTFTHHTAEDEQWLYLPAVGRVKRITSSNRAGPFVGSEFAYEDLTAHQPWHFRHQFVERSACGDATCIVVDRTPLDARSGYSRQRVWWHAERLSVERIEYFDRRGQLLKTLACSGYVRYADRFWRAGRMRMENVQTRRVTVLEWSDRRFGSGLTADGDFSQASLAGALPP